MDRRTRTDRGVLVTRVTFEMSRLGARWLVEAYEQAVPVARRRPGEKQMRQMERRLGGQYLAEELGQ